MQCQVNQKTFKLFEDIEKNKTDENNKEDSIKSVTEYIILLTKQSYECKEKREKSMISHSTRLIEVIFPYDRNRCGYISNIGVCK